MNFTQAAIERARQENIRRGVCQDCGGSGVVAAMAKIARTGDPHVNMRCRRCKGTGKPAPPPPPGATT